MRICIVAEGCYPYVVGGVSSWIHSLIAQFPQHEFIILAIVADRSYRGNFVYDLAGNVAEVYEMYLQDMDWSERESKGASHVKLKKKEINALRSLLLNNEVDWNTMFEMMENPSLSVNDLLMGVDFLEAVKDCYRTKYRDAVFSDFLWTMRSIYLPMFLVMKFNVPKADLYHCVATGYAGLLGTMAKKKHGSHFLISEHGIYTREREEELVKAKWVQGIYKSIWIDQFRKMSYVAYQRCDLVTSLYEHARELQIDLGCPPEKTMVTPNGINTERFQNLRVKLPEDEGYINIGAVLRVTPIKDVKTMIRAFYYAKSQEKSLKLWIMGPWDEDQEYANECFELVESMKIEDVVFTGRINVTEYLGRMDCTILTSISEGQPLTILEGYAAKKPVIATDVGNCYGLIYGEDDDFGPAGILTHIMNVEEIASAMVRMARNETERLQMGEAGYKRLMRKYKVEDMRDTYRSIYDGFEHVSKTSAISAEELEKRRMEEEEPWESVDKVDEEDEPWASVDVSGMDDPWK
ncbi:MAG: GT4 family glycosyltransferase PelF [Lachnospiraceae bacterium]|nr:GT4 family glycosyltransferase PelF [Lachnospiraceae bacterium]